MPYNPGVQDISGQLLGQGISQFGEGLAQGIQAYGKQKEERQFLTSSIENKLGVALNEMQKFQANPKLYGGVAPITPEMLEQFQTAPGASLGKLKALNADLDVTLARSQNAINDTLKKSQADQYAAHAAMLNDELVTAQGDRKGMMNATLELSQLPQGQFSGELAYKIGAKHGLSPKAMETFTRGVQDLLPKPGKAPDFKTVDTTGPNGERIRQTFIISGDGAMQLVGTQNVDAPPPGYAPTPTGLKPIEGGPAAIKQQETVKKEAEKTQKEASRAASARAEIEQSLRNLRDAELLIQNKGAGGGIEGLPGVRGTLAALGKPESKVLNSKYNSLKSAIKLEKLSEMKSLSANGSSGLGQLSDRENASLSDFIAELDPSLPEKDQLEALGHIKKYLTRLHGGLTAPGGAYDYSKADAIIGR